MIAATITTAPAGNTNTGEDHQGTATRSDSSLFTEARRWADRHGVTIGHSKLSRTIRAYQREIAARSDRGPVLTLETYLRRTWADPVGETAVRNVMRGGH